MKEIPHEVTLSLAKPRKPEADRITYRKVALVETTSCEQKDMAEKQTFLTGMDGWAVLT